MSFKSAIFMGHKTVKLNGAQFRQMDEGSFSAPW